MLIKLLPHKLWLRLRVLYHAMPNIRISLLIIIHRVLNPNRIIIIKTQLPIQLYIQILLTLILRVNLLHRSLIFPNFPNLQQLLLHMKPQTANHIKILRLKILLLPMAQIHPVQPVIFKLPILILIQIFIMLLQLLQRRHQILFKHFQQRKLHIILVLLITNTIHPLHLLLLIHPLLLKNTQHLARNLLRVALIQILHHLLQILIPINPVIIQHKLQRHRLHLNIVIQHVICQRPEPIKLRLQIFLEHIRRLLLIFINIREQLHQEHVPRQRLDLVLQNLLQRVNQLRHRVRRPENPRGFLDNLRLRDDPAELRENIRVKIALDQLVALVHLVLLQLRVENVLVVVPELLRKFRGHFLELVLEFDVREDSLFKLLNPLRVVLVNLAFLERLVLDFLRLEHAQEFGGSLTLLRQPLRLQVHFIQRIRVLELLAGLLVRDPRVPQPLRLLQVLIALLQVGIVVGPDADFRLGNVVGLLVGVAQPLLELLQLQNARVVVVLHVLEQLHEVGLDEVAEVVDPLVQREEVQQADSVVFAVVFEDSCAVHSLVVFAVVADRVGLLADEKRGVVLLRPGEELALFEELGEPARRLVVGAQLELDFEEALGEQDLVEEALELFFEEVEVVFYVLFDGFVVVLEEDLKDSGGFVGVEAGYLLVVVFQLQDYGELAVNVLEGQVEEVHEPALHLDHYALVGVFDF